MFKENLRVIYLITGEIKSKIDQIWNAFWSGGSSLVGLDRKAVQKAFSRYLQGSNYNEK